MLDEVSRLVPTFDEEEVVHTAKIHFLQSIVSAIMVEDIFDTGNYFIGLSDEQAEQFRRMEMLVGAFSRFKFLNFFSSAVTLLDVLMNVCFLRHFVIA